MHLKPQKLSLFALIVFFVFSSFYAQSAQNNNSSIGCNGALKTLSFIELPLADVLSMESLEDDNFEYSDNPQPTIFFKGLTKDGKIQFTKPANLPWGSMYILDERGDTFQGDLRWPIAFMGYKISKFLGFSFHISSDGSIELFTPNADFLFQRLLELNERLKSKGLPPISYLPQKSGFATDLEILQISSLKKGDFEILFPFADDLANLTPHEIAFHLGGLLYPRELNIRARLINQRTLQMYETLKSDPDLKELAETLVSERVLEMDGGTAVLGTIVGKARRKKMTSYSSLNDHLAKEYKAKITEVLGYYSKNMSVPFEAVIHRIYYATGGAGRNQIHSWPEQTPQIQFNPFTLNFGREVKIKPEAKERLNKILLQFEKEHLPDRINWPAEKEAPSVENILKYLDQRTQEIESVI